MSYDIDPEKREALLESGVLNHAAIVAGLQVESMTIATSSLLSRLRQSIENPDWAFIAAARVWLHSVGVERRKAIESRPSSAVSEIFDFLRELSPEQLVECATWGKSQEDMLNATLTAAMQSSGLIDDPKA